MDLEEDFWRVQFPGVPGWSPGEDLDVILESKLYFTKEGFGNRPSLYPATVTQARYGGTYEGGGVGGLWLAFPVSPELLSRQGGGWEEWNDSDIECAAWWDRANGEGWPIGRGDCPSAAWQSLLAIVAAKAGVRLEDLTAAPSWPERGNG